MLEVQPLTRLAACLSESLTSGVKATLVFVLTHHLRGLIDICGRDGSITDQSAVIQKQDVMFGVVSSPLAAVAQRLHGQQRQKKKKKKRKAQKSVLQRRCGAFGAFLENLNSVSYTCAFGFFRSAAQRGWGFDAEQGRFPCLRRCCCAAGACVCARPPRRLGSATADQFVAEACLLIVAPPCRSRW